MLTVFSRTLIVALLTALVWSGAAGAPGLAPGLDPAPATAAKAKSGKTQKGKAKRSGAKKSKQAKKDFKSLPSSRKAIWGPTDAFSTYKKLRVGIWQYQLLWNQVATRRPDDPRDPDDPAYSWPAALDQAVKDARKAKIDVALMVRATPGWANGGQAFSIPPTSDRDYADFVVAAAKRYPRVRRWMIWGEPNQHFHWAPTPARAYAQPLSKADREAPRRYARLVDRAYGALKARSKRNLVIAGMTFTTGHIAPRDWIRNMRLPNGKPPRMDLYGHNPFSARRPNLKNPRLEHGLADMSSVRHLAGWVDRWIDRRRSRKARRADPMELYLSEFTLPTDHANRFFNFYVSRGTQASWLRSALAIARKRSSRIAAFGWFTLQDQPSAADGYETHWGLVDEHGKPKPAYAVFRRGR